MKILFLSPTGTLGGAERVLLSIFGALRGTEVRPHLLTFEDGPLAARASELDVRVVVLPLPIEVARLG